MIVGLMEVMIALLCVYLVFKGVEIFQIAFMASDEHPTRSKGLMIGILAIIFAVITAAIGVYLSVQMIIEFGDKTPNFIR